ncbi:M24 family metallopeptidase, partial [Acinetobacter baumannii]
MNYVNLFDNAEDEAAHRKTGAIKLHGPEGFAGMRKAGRLAAETLDYLTEHVRPGVTTGEIDRLGAAFIAARGGVSAPLGY